MQAVSSGRHVAAPISNARTFEVKVCTGKACKRQKSPQILKMVQDLPIPTVSVESCGCLGGCGKGPNMAIIEDPRPGPSGNFVDGNPPRPVLLSNVTTLSDVVDTLRGVCDIPISHAEVHSLQARLQGNELAQEGKLQEAIEKYSEGISDQPLLGLHLLLCNRSAAYLQLGQKEEALRDSLRALELSPAGFAKSWIRSIDAYYALERFKEAADLAVQAVKQNPTFKVMTEFKAIYKALQQAGQDIKL